MRVFCVQNRVKANLLGPFYSAFHCHIFWEQLEGIHGATKHLRSGILGHGVSVSVQLRVCRRMIHLPSHRFPMEPDRGLLKDHLPFEGTPVRFHGKPVGGYILALAGFGNDNKGAGNGATPILENNGGTQTCVSIWVKSIIFHQPEIKLVGGGYSPHKPPGRVRSLYFTRIHAKCLSRGKIAFCSGLACQICYMEFRHNRRNKKASLHDHVRDRLPAVKKTIRAANASDSDVGCDWLATERH